MKSILLVRHAKSSWDFEVDDFDRPLNKRGETDAPAMAKRLQSKGIQIDLLICSPANRTLRTARYFAEVYNLNNNKIVEISTLYEPVIDAFYNAIKTLDDKHNSIAIFSHNPGITAFANQLTDTKIDDMPTCAIFGVNAQIDHWKDFGNSKKQFWLFDYPRSL